MSRVARLPVAERYQTPLVQAHAFDHYLHGRCSGAFPIADARTDMRCPLCLRWLARAEFSLEHAPQQAGQSRLGPAWLLTSTCKDCNSTAGRTFESDAAGVATADRAAQSAPACAVHGTDHGDQSFNTGWISAHEPMTVADLKSAYLIVFAVLGYSWATSRRLDRLRTAIASGEPADEADAFLTCGLLSDTTAQRTVKEVSGPLPIVLVVAPESKFVVALPAPGTADVRLVCEAIQGTSITFRDYRWPLMVRETERELGATGFTKPEDAWDQGLTFHLDRCDQHHVAVNPARRTTRALNGRANQAPPT